MRSTLKNKLKIIKLLEHNDPYVKSIASYLYTEFKNGKKVQDVKNRLVTFPSHLYHTGNTCTDNSYRMVLNLNYY